MLKQFNHLTGKDDIENAIEEVQNIVVSIECSGQNCGECSYRDLCHTCLLLLHRLQTLKDEKTPLKSL